eukprot:gb/GECG01015437.1/.p1 GENE.gb/GECG01015437.1/~~gb/GECG01015437.1/.p1  ORF type:complete len:760 (+),score=72.74 gb/GECG01015437.1/:1-2280(+)
MSPTEVQKVRRASVRCLTLVLFLAVATTAGLFRIKGSRPQQGADTNGNLIRGRTEEGETTSYSNFGGILEPWRTLEASNFSSCAEQLTDKFGCDTPGCSSTKAGFINYIMLYECEWSDYKGVLWVGMIFWLAYMFYMLANSADAYFCPTLQVIVDMLNLSPNAAGVTFLSFGNGAPDVFSSLAAYSSGQSSVGLSAILGAGMFVQSAILGAVVLISKEFLLKRRPFLRDVVFYTIGIIYLFVNFHFNKFGIGQAAGLLILYVLYATVAVVGHRIYKSRKEQGYEKASHELSSSDLVLKEMNGNTPRAENVKRENLPDETLEEKLESDDLRRSASTGKIGRENMDEKLAFILKDEVKPVGNSYSVHSPNNDATSSRRHSVHSGALWDTDIHPAHHLTREELRHMFEDHPDPVLFPHAHRRVDQLLSSLRYEAEEEEELLTMRRESSRLGAQDAHITPDQPEELTKDLIPSKGSEVEDISEKSFIDKHCGPGSALYCFLNYLLLPSQFVRNLSVPLLSEDEYDWRYVTVTPFFGSPWIVITGLRLLSEPAELFKKGIAGSIFPWYALPLIAGILGTVVLFFVLPRKVPGGDGQLPHGVLRGALTIFAFFSSVSWIINAAHEIVTILHAIGLILSIPSTVLGIAILAVGNSSSDMAADLSVAKEGLPNMAIAACHAGPSFNVLFGLGLSNLVGIAKHGSEHLQPGKSSNTLVYVAFGFILTAAVSCLVLVPLQGFRMKRPFGFYMLGLYTTFFITVVVLAAT